MKRVGNLFENLISFNNLHKAYKKAYKGSGKTAEACEFSFHLEKNLIELGDRINKDIYRPKKYRYFTIYDPKERIISVAEFKDKVVHHAVVGALEPVFEKSFIYDSYATRKNKGTHKAILKAQSFLKNNSYYLKSDISKYFQSIDHKILISLIKRKIKDRRLINLIKHIIDNNDISRQSYKGKGIPVGNLTSQFFANVYLDCFDHYIKEEKGMKNYIRYMDDIVIFSDSKIRLKTLLNEMKLFLFDNLNLVLKPSATMINSRNHGLSYLGFRVFPALIRIRKQNYKRITQRLKSRNYKFKKGIISEEDYITSVRSVFVHTGFANSYGLRKKDLVLRAGVI